MTIDIKKIKETLSRNYELVFGRLPGEALHHSFNRKPASEWVAVTDDGYQFVMYNSKNIYPYSSILSFEVDASYIFAIYEQYKEHVQNVKYPLIYREDSRLNERLNNVFSEEDLL